MDRGLRLHKVKVAKEMDSNNGVFLMYSVLPSTL